MNVKFNFNNAYNYVSKLPSRASRYIQNKRFEFSEKRIAKHFALHNFTTEGNSADVIYPMRKAIANFAKKNGVKIDVYDSRTPVEINGITSYHADNDAHRNIRIVVKDKRYKGKGQDNSAVMSGDTTKIYNRARVRQYIVGVPGEDTQIARQVKTTTEDVFLKYFLRKIDYLVQEVRNSRV